MRGQSLGALGLLLVGAVALFAFSRAPQPDGKDEPKAAESKPFDRVLPGLRKDGSVQLPNQWSLKPAGRQLELGDFPVNIALHPTGEFAAVLCAGFKEHEVIIVDLNPDRTRVVSRAQIDQAFYGLAFSNDGKQLFASGGEFEVVHVFDFDRGYLVKGRQIDGSTGKAKGVIGGITLDPTGKDLFVASPWADAVIRVPLVNPDNKKIIPMVPVAEKKGEAPKGEPPSPPDGRKEDKKEVKKDPARENQMKWVVRVTATKGGDIESMNLREEGSADPKGKDLGSDVKAFLREAKVLYDAEKKRIDAAKAKGQTIPEPKLTLEIADRLVQAHVIQLLDTAKEAGFSEIAPVPIPKEEDEAKLKGPEFFPYTCLVEPGGKRCFVSLWAKAAVAVIDLEKNTVTQTWPTAEHPTEMVLSPKGDALYVACANSTKVSVLDPATGKGIQTIHCALYPGAPNGNTPNSLALTPDGEILFVANADNNNLAVLNVADPKNAKPMGFIPTGWYPTSVRFNPHDKTIYVANGKGLSSKANRGGPNPLLPRARNLNEYIGQLFTGTLGMLKMPTPEAMATYSKQAYACSPLQKDNAVRSEDVEPDNPIPKKLGDPSPIKYVLYIVKENRTYDQMLGDIKTGNGEAELCLFPESVTPNHHKIAREFVLLDNFYVDGEVSADGHEWTMGAYATDFVEKIWPLSYRGGKIFGYPSEGAYDAAARPSGGYLWDKCAEAKVSYRTYGEWVNNGKKNADGTFEDSKPAVKELEGKFDPKFRGYDLDYPDVKRAERFISELKRFEAAGEMPRMQVLRLPNDHTAGSKLGSPTVTAMVADNDLALGMVVEAVSQSKFWKEMAVFVIEDDTQNGPDHVDAHRCPALVISPYTKRKFTDSTLYSTTSMLRTMELILGVKPMSQFDSAARPMYHSFTAKPDLTAFKHEVPKVDLNEKNKPGGFGAAWMDTQNLAKEDMLDDMIFNEIIWKAVKGVKSEIPPPVRAAFFVPVKPPEAKKDDDDDDDDD